MARRERKTAAQAWLERWNPLQGMSIREAQNIFDVARNGDTQRLHWLFQEIEATNPVLLVCVERRSSAIANFQWKISENAASDGSLSAEQKDAAERFLNGVENLTDALEHMDLAFFRGFAHAQPVWEADGTVKEVQLLDSWKFVRQGGAWFYNPACTGFSSDMQPTDRCGLMTVVRRRPIDYPALAIHIRHAVGSRDWGRFLERYALPKPAVFMHPGATNDQRADYIEAANAVENGQVSVWPAGASLTDFAGGSRGTDPFGSFIEHQEKQIVLLATGGTLMSLAESGSGTLAGGAQSEVWESIVARDSSVIAQAVQRAMVIPYLVRAFPGKPVAVSFGFDFTKPPTPKEVFEVAALAKQAGWRIDQAQLEEQTGYTLAEDTTPSSGGVSASPSGGYPFLNKAPHSPKAHEGNPGIPAGGPRSVAAADGTEAVLPSAVLKAFAEDTGAAAAAVRKLLENPTPDGAAALLHDLPSLIPEDPALASVIAEAMAAEFASTASQSSQKSQPSQNAPLANKTDANGMEHAERGEDGGQFVKKDGGSSDGQPTKAEKKTETKTEERKRTCAEALEAYKASSDHPSVEDIVSGKISIEEAVKKGFEAKFGGQKVIFFTQEKIGDKYQGRDEAARLGLIRHALTVRGNMFPVQHSGDQIGIVEGWTRKNSNRRFVITADKDTAVAVSVMRCDDAYIKRNYKK